MKFNQKYYNLYLITNKFRNIGRRFFSPIASPLLRILKKLPDNSKIIDVGSGLGGFLQKMEHINPRFSTYGVDLGFAPKFLSKGCFSKGSIDRLPFKNNSFDLVTCAHVLEHLENPFLAIEELKRVCKTSGTIYIETPSHRSTLLPIGLNFWDDPTHIRPYTSKSLYRLLEMNDLEVVSYGTKHSTAGIILGLPYILLGKILGDPAYRSIFPTYAFGCSVFAVGKKTP